MMNWWVIISLIRLPVLEWCEWVWQLIYKQFIREIKLLLKIEVYRRLSVPW